MEIEDQVQVDDGARKRPSRSWGVIFAWVAVLGLLVLLGFGLLKTTEGPLELGELAPDFKLETFDGQVLDTEAMRGQIILINFWASWCVTCIDEAEELEQAYQMYKDQGVEFIGVDWSDTESKALAYLEKYGITYPNGPDLEQRIYQSYRVRGVPETYILAHDGSLSVVKIGAFQSLEEIVRAIEKAASD
jgi:cytochrome c biogenesis protein CcmG/thiol:disulfide interchange protein DsbE